MTTTEMRQLADQAYPRSVQHAYVQCEARHDEYRGRYVFSVGGMCIPEWLAAEYLRNADTTDRGMI